MEEREFGRIKKNDQSEIVVRISNFKNVERIDIREFIKTDSYTGFTKKGVSIPLSELDNLRRILAAIHIEEEVSK